LLVDCYVRSVPHVDAEKGCEWVIYWLKLYLIKG
jgi:hypothetical protein